CQSWPTWWEYHWLDKPIYGLEWKTVGIAEGDGSEAQPRRGPLELWEPRQRTPAERGRVSRAGPACAASSHWREGLQRIRQGILSHSGWSCGCTLRAG